MDDPRLFLFADDRFASPPGPSYYRTEITLRDLAALAWTAGVLSNPTVNAEQGSRRDGEVDDTGILSRGAFDFADAFLKAREETQDE